MNLMRKWVTGVMIGACGLISLQVHARAPIALDTWLITALRFVDWPPGANSSTSKITVCHPTNELQHSRLAGQVVKGVILELRPVMTPQETGPCQAFFTSSSSVESYPSWLSALHDRPILTMGLTAAFCTSGGLICPARSDYPHVHFAVNHAAANRVGLRVSSHLPSHDTAAFTTAERRGVQK